MQLVVGQCCQHGKFAACWPEAARQGLARRQTTVTEVLMGALLGLGMSHYPGFLYGDEELADVSNRVKIGTIPRHLADPAKWPDEMRRELGDDDGRSFAAAHRADFAAAIGRARAALDSFAPDAVVIFGEDRYERFREDLVPPFCIFIGSEFRARPFAAGRAGRTVAASYWGDAPDAELRFPGAERFAAELTGTLIERGFDVAYSYADPGAPVSHSFANTILYLDQQRAGWPYPVVPFHVNAYGSHLIRARRWHQSGSALAGHDSGPPPPTPARSFALGEAIADAVLAGPLRVALIGSASWSHSSGVPAHDGLYPDVDADRARFEELRAGRYPAWAAISQQELDAAGQTEFLNWLPLIGAMSRCGAGKPVYCAFHETYLMSSVKCTAVFAAVEAGPDGNP
jgi:hypothetical protein